MSAGADAGAAGRDVFAYEPRKLTCDPVVEVQGYRIKPYRMAFPSASAEQAAAAAPAAAWLARLLTPPEDPNYHGLGFSVLHVARDGVYQLIGRWYAGNNLMSEAFEVTGDIAGDRVTFTRLPLFACIWEMAVYVHERDSWVKTIMASGRRLEGADAYLQCRLEGWV
ncbi:MAG TPA: hypothetical protein VFZ91_10250 [Allosphingosinicella sp.]